MVPTSARQNKEVAVEASPAGETGTQGEKAAETRPSDDAASAAADRQKEQQQRKQEEWRPKETEQQPKREETVAEPSEDGKLVCNRHGPFSDTCDVDDDVRTNGTAHSVTLVPESSQVEHREWKVCHTRAGPCPASRRSQWRSSPPPLLEMLGPEHPVIKDPESVHRSGWDKVAKYYLGKQDVRVDVECFVPTLALVLDHLRQQ